MRCYRIDEDAHQGIPLSMNNNGGLYIDVGEEETRVDDALTARLCAAKVSVVETLRSILQTGVYDSECLSDDERKRVGNTLDRVESENIRLIYADVGPDGEVIPETKRSPDALVLVETASGPNGRIYFKSSTYDEYLDTRSNRVRRRYQQLFPPPGVTVIKEGKTAQGGRAYLLRMAPNSSFRIERTGLLDGAPSVLTVVWRSRRSPNGASPLLMFSPDRRQD